MFNSTRITVAIALFMLGTASVFGQDLILQHPGELKAARQRWQDAFTLYLGATADIENRIATEAPEALLVEIRAAMQHAERVQTAKREVFQIVVQRVEDQIGLLESKDGGVLGGGLAETTQSTMEVVSAMQRQLREELAREPGPAEGADALRRQIMREQADKADAVLENLKRQKAEIDSFSKLDDELRQARIRKVESLRRLRRLMQTQLDLVDADSALEKLYWRAMETITLTRIPGRADSPQELKQ